MKSTKNLLMLAGVVGLGYVAVKRAKATKAAQQAALPSAPPTATATADYPDMVVGGATRRY